MSRRDSTRARQSEAPPKYEDAIALAERVPSYSRTIVSSSSSATLIRRRSPAQGQSQAAPADPPPAPTPIHPIPIPLHRQSSRKHFQRVLRSLKFKAKGSWYRFKQNMNSETWVMVGEALLAGLMVTVIVIGFLSIIILMVV
jgi:hypothetical protein